MTLQIIFYTPFPQRYSSSCIFLLIKDVLEFYELGTPYTKKAGCVKKAKDPGTGKQR